MKPPPRVPAMDKAYRLLAGRPHSQKELEAKLAQRGYTPQEIDAVVSRLLELKYIDDGQYCRRFAENRLARMNIGSARMRMDLAAKGFDHGLVDRTINELYTDEQKELIIARSAAAKKLRSLKPGLDERAVRKKLYDHLSRKGFSGDLARQVALGGLDELKDLG